MPILSRWALSPSFNGVTTPINGLIKWVSLDPRNCTKITGSQVPIFPPQITPSFPSIRCNHDESPGRSGASWNLGQSDGFSSGLYEVEALSCFIASFEKAWWIHGNKKSHFGGRNKWVSFGETSEISSKLSNLAVFNHWVPKILWKRGKNTPLQVSCATEMDWKFGIPKGGFGTKGPRDFCVCWLVFCPPVGLPIGKWWVERNPFQM